MLILLQIKNHSHEKSLEEKSNLTEEPRIAKQEVLIQKHELDW